MVCLVRAAWKHSPLLFAALKVDFRLFGFPSSVVKLFVGFLQLFSGLVQLLFVKFSFSLGVVHVLLYLLGDG